MMFFLGIWFPDRLRGRINNLFISAIPLGGILAGPLAAWIMGGLNDVYGLRGWQWLFLVEGLAAALLGIAAFFFLTSSPASAGWLTDGEKRIVVIDQQAAQERRWSNTMDSTLVLARDPTVWLLGMVYFGYFCSLNTLILWSPSLLALSGVQSISAIGWISGLSGVVSAVGMLAIGLSSDRLNERRWHVGLCGLVAASCFLLLPLTADSIPATAGLLLLAATGLYAVLGLFWTIPGAYFRANSAARGFALINMFGVGGGIVSPTLVGWLKVQTDSLYVGVSVIAILLALSMLMLLRLPQPNQGSFTEE